MPITTLQNFYKETCLLDWEAGAGTFYVSRKPTTSFGWLVISPANSSLREIVKFSSTGTDSTGDYVVISNISDRGLGGTTNQSHAAGEPIRMNWSSLNIQELSDAVDQIVAAGAQDSSETVKGLVEEATDAEVTAGTATGGTGAKLFVTPAKLATRLTFKNGIASKNIQDASTTQTIAHGLGRTPKKFRFTALCDGYAGVSSQVVGVYNGTTQSLVGSSKSGSTPYAFNSTTYAAALANDNTTPATTGQTGVVTFDATNITITWTKNGSPSAGTFNFMWEVE